MRLSLQLPYVGSPRDAVDLVVRLEAAGLDGVWVAEAWGFDSPTMMGFLAARTQRVTIGAGILNVYSRTPSLIAQTAAGLDHVSHGRAMIGIGTSGPQVVEGWHGVAFTDPVERLVETMQIVRQVLRRDVLTHRGVFDVPTRAPGSTGLGKPLRLLVRPERSAIPIWVAALGPKAVAATATWADGWLPLLFSPQHAADVWGEALAAGARRRRGDLPGLEVSASVLAAIGDDTSHARATARQYIARYVGGMGARGRNYYFDVVSAYGFRDAAIRIQDHYLAGAHAAAADCVPDELVTLTQLIGTPSEVRQRLTAYQAAGVSELQLTFVGADPVGEFTILRELRSSALSPP